MELYKLGMIVASLKDLADIEREHPVLGAQLRTFVKDVRTSCNQAYGRLSKALRSVLSLPSRPTEQQLESVSKEIFDAPDSVWFREVAGICERLEALSLQFEPQLKAQIDYLHPRSFYHPTPTSQDVTPYYDKLLNIGQLIEILQRHEGDLKDDIRSAVNKLLAKLGDAKTTGSAEEAKQYALQVQQEISASNDQIAQLSYQIEGRAPSGAENILTSSEIAEAALRRPEQMLILSMFFLIVVFSLGAFGFKYLKFYQFSLVSGFALTAVVVLNAIYLRTIDKLSEENFLKLMELALLKFFAPLARKRLVSKEASRLSDSTPNDA